jgi:hypothetical protein
MLPLLFYVIFCLMASTLGIGRRIGFIGSFVLSFLLTPILMALVLLLTAPRAEKPKAS